MPHTGDPHRHAVKFYENDASLFRTVGEYLSQALVDGHPCLVVATDAHAIGILDELSNRMIDVARASGRGQLLVLSADQTLATFMRDGRPDAELFHRHVGETVADIVRAHEGRAVVRAFGEMVDVLWKQGSHDAAIRLEILWNELSARLGFELLCAYSMRSFYEHAELVERICEQHTHVMPPFDVPDGARRH
jgi:hypothetical protein